MFEIRTFHLAGYFSGKAEESPNQNKRFKNQLWVWGSLCKLCTLSGLCLFYHSYHMRLSFPDLFDEFFFYASSFSPKSVPSSHHWTNTHHVGVLNSLNHISWMYTLNPLIKSRAQARTDMKYKFVIKKSSKDSMHNTEYFSYVESYCQI